MVNTWTGENIRIVLPNEFPKKLLRIDTRDVYSIILTSAPLPGLQIDSRYIVSDFSMRRALVMISPELDVQILLREHNEDLILFSVSSSWFREIFHQYADELPIFRGEVYIPHPELLGIVRCYLLEVRDRESCNRSLSANLESVITHLTVKSLLAKNDGMIPIYDRYEVEKAIDFIMTHYDERISLEALAREAHRSRVHFSKIFKSVTTKTPMRFLLDYRIDKSRKMLSCSNKSISEIATACGFSTSSYFSSIFTKQEGVSPSSYRNRLNKRSKSVRFR